MMKLQKKFASIIIAIVAVAVLAAALIFVGYNSDTAFAVTDDIGDESFLMDFENYFEISADGVLIGLSAEGLLARENNAFYAIKTPQSVKSIAPFAFDEDLKLVKLTVGSEIKEIGANAFYGCSQLSVLEFEGEVIAPEMGENDTPELRTLSIGQKSFAMCANLGNIKFPKRLAKIGYAAFADCSNVDYAYLPGGVTFDSRTTVDGDTDTTDNGNMLYFGFVTRVVFENRSAYAATLQESHPLHSNTLRKTYLIDIDFQYGDDTYEIITRLQGDKFEKVYDKDGNWIVDEAVELPLQEGYANTVWYQDVSDFGSAVTERDINDKLAAADADDFRLTAIYREVAAFAPLKEFVFDGSHYPFATHLGKLISAEGATGAASDMTRYAVVKAVKDGEPVDELYGAGDYSIELNLAEPEKYGSWLENQKVEISVEKLTVDISLFDNLRWWVSDYNVNFGDGTLYEYTYKVSGASQTYYSVVKLDIAPNPEWTDWTLKTFVSAQSAIVYQRGDNDTVTVEITGKYPDAFTVKYTDNVKTDLGKHTSRAVVTPTENYKFTIPSGANSNFANRGMTVSLSSITGTATMTKTWYIVKNDKSLLDEKKSIAAKTEVEFVMPSWTFGDDISNETLAKPRLQHDNPSTGGYGYTFDITLKQGDEVYTICLGEASNRWNFYINKYMPAGVYTITVRVGAKSMGSHTHWWNDETHGSGDVIYDFKEFMCSLYFQVHEGTFKLLDGYGSTIPGIDVIAGGDAGEVNIADLKNGFGAFFAYAEGGFGFNGINTTGYISADEVRSSGTHWANVTSNYFDDEPVMKYNLARMYNRTYLAANDADWNKYINTPGDYRVYYMATMKNYAGVPEINGDRFERYYTISVFAEINAPTLGRTEFTFTGRTLTVNYTSHVPSDGYLYIISGNVERNCGKYNAKFTLGDKKHYRWVQKDSTGKDYSFDEDGNLLLPYEIVRAVVPVPVLPEAYYSGEAIFVEIPVLTDLDGNEIYDVDYGRRYESLYFTEVGDHYIDLKIKDSANYVWESGDPDDTGEIQVVFTIQRAWNNWAVAPYVVEWETGMFDTRTNLLTAVPMDGTVRFFVTDSMNSQIPLDGLGEFTLQNGFVSKPVAEAFNKLSVGTYYLWAQVDETDNYSSIEPTYCRFDVQTLTNRWIEMPNVIRWVWGSYEAEYNVITAKSLKGTPRFRIYRDGTPVTSAFTSSQSVANTLNNLPSGEYVLRAFVDADNKSGYSGIDATDTVFNILQATNRWVQTPNIIRWSQGLFNSTVNVISAEPLHGSVIFSIMQDGIAIAGLGSFTLDEANTSAVTDILAGMKAGTYDLVAYVEEDVEGNYTELNTTMHFNVLASTNYWKQTPNIIRWTWGEYQTAKNVISAEPAFGNAEDVVFSIWQNGQPKAGLTGFRTVDDRVSIALGGLDAGEYILKAELDTTGFDTLRAEVAFNVMQATNYWIQTPNIARWIAVVETPHDPTGESRYGTPHYIIYSLDENGAETGVVYDNALSVNDLAYVPAGWYKMVANVDADTRGNYTGLNSTTLNFRVFEPDTEVFNIAKTNALESLRLYVSMYGVMIDASYERRISEARTLDEINDALSEGMAAVDAAAFVLEKQAALAELAEYEAKYGIKCDDKYRENIEAAVTGNNLVTAKSLALQNVDWKAMLSAREVCAARVAQYEAEKGMLCDPVIKDRLAAATSYENAHSILAEALADIDLKADTLKKAKTAAIESLKSYFKGKGIEFDEQYIYDINDATSIEAVKLAYDRIVENSPKRDDSNVKGLTAGLVIFALLAIAGAVAVTVIVLQRKRAAKATAVQDSEDYDDDADVEEAEEPAKDGYVNGVDDYANDVPPQYDDDGTI